ncbi:MAG: DUF6624 domain-containing protein [Bacteroidota bacterium]
MKYKIICLLLVIIVKSNTIYSQDFSIIKNKADSLRECGDIEGAIFEFRKAYNENSKNGLNLYNFSCLFSKIKQYDSCFKYLNLSIELDTNFIAFTEADFIPFRKSKYWNKFESRLLKMIELKYKNKFKDLEYAKKLWKMSALDQAYYSDISVAEKKIGTNSTVVNALWDLKEIINNKNQKELELLIQKKGWPKISSVGYDASITAFLIIQHSDITKQKKYLPTIQQLCKLNEADWQDYALMYDRIQTSENKPQRYGSQIRFNEITKSYELYPLEDETKVEEWRNELGMVSLADYLSLYGIKFEPKK